MRHATRIDRRCAMRSCLANGVGQLVQLRLGKRRLAFRSSAGAERQRQVLSTSRRGRVLRDEETQSAARPEPGGEASGRGDPATLIVELRPTASAGEAVASTLNTVEPRAGPGRAVDLRLEAPARAVDCGLLVLARAIELEGQSADVANPFVRGV